MAATQLTVSIKRAWWVIPYVRACMVFAWLTGMEPDGEKIADTAMRGMKFEFKSQ
ncbi:MULTISPECIES: hypothetical protein [unclassified Pseudomonas]|uniref:hypothetical protein n=1 Tax=unclassified Pseudomonas TaxID=196821 RepID=UPI000AA7BA6B|nr:MULTISPECIES: hypothetical protein [unclassified Pseudomonas]